MVRVILAAVLLILVTPDGYAEPDSYELKVVRAGKTISAVATRFWSGEYPMPVINVSSESGGTTAVMAHDGLRNPGKAKKCTIRNGLYHPWSQTPNSVELYYSIDAADIYIATTDVSLDGTILKKGDRMIVTYLAEGMCQGTVLPKKANGKPKVGQFSCDLPKSLKSETTGPKQELQEQWLYLKCAEGHKAFVRDEELLKQKGVKPGSIVGYGKVGK